MTNSVVIAIRKREVLLRSGSASKIYDGLPLRNEVVTVGGDGFAVGEGMVFDVTGVQTDVGESENLFTYSLTEGTKASNYTIRQEYGVLSVTNPPLQTLLEDTLKDFGTVESDGEDGWRIALTNTVQGPLDLGDGLGTVTLDLQGRELVGKEGAPGSVTLPGGAGYPAIRIAASANGMDAPTHLVVVDSVGGPGVRGGRGGDGTPGGRGGAGIEVASSACAGVSVSIGPGVTVRGGDGGRDLSGTGRGGDGGSGVDGAVERNDGTLAGGTGGDSASGYPGEGGPASSGEVGGGAGTLVQTALRLPSIPTKVWEGKTLSPDVPSSPRYVAGTVVATGPGDWPVPFALTDTRNYRWADAEGPLVYATFTVLPPRAVHVSFDLAGGTLVGIDFLEVLPGGTYPALPVPVRAQFDFLGWFDHAGNRIRAGDYVEVFENHILVAHWERSPMLGFVEPEVAVDEGGTATVAVRGGSAERATSVQVHLSYQTASAADLDLKNAAVDGATPKGGLRFPLMLSWAAGEIGVKTLAIPVKTDRAVEDDEVFTLQLANAQGMTVGEADACTVTVRDANAAADYAAKQSKTTVRTKKGVPDCALSVACVARDGSGAVCGYTTGQGSYYAGCRASLRATARPGWAFAGWGEVVDGVTNVVGTKAGWTVTPTNDTEIVALFERIPYIRALADPADGGKASGSGYCAAGKKVALKATASRNFTFAGWYAAGAPGAPVATTPTLVLDRSAKPAKGDARQTVLTDVDGDATYFARFVGDPEVSVTVSATDGRGAEPAGKGAGRYVAGTVTGAGRYAPGKKAVLKATANRGYVFAGWREAGADGTLSRSAAYTIGAMPPDDVALVAAFVTADEDRESVAASLGGLPLAPWVSKTETHALATNVRAGVYLEWPLAASALSETTVKVAGLPAGLRFAARPVTSRSGTGRSAVLVTNVPANTVYGAPTAASRTVTDRRTGAVTVTPSAVKVTVTTAGRSSRTYQIDTTVDPLPAWAQGTFSGVSYADADGAETNGLAAVSVTAAGKVSAKQTAAGRAASFTAPWYDRHDAAEDAYHATLTAKVGAAVVTNRVTVRAAAHAATDAVPAETALGVMRGDLLDAWQTDWRREPWNGFAAALARARPPLACAYEVGGGQPGTVSLKFGANGAVTAAGTFATGVDARGRETTAKASCSATLLPQGGDRYLVFVYFPPKGTFRGHARCLALAWDGAGFVEDVAW